MTDDTRARELIAKAKELAAKATPGEWTMGSSNVGYVYAADCVIATCGNFKDKELAKFNSDRWNADAAFIAFSRTALPALEKRVVELEADLAETRHMLADADRALVAAGKLKGGGYWARDEEGFGVLISVDKAISRHKARTGGVS